MMISSAGKLLLFTCLVIISFNSLAQTQKWIARYNGPGNQSDNANLIQVDASGNSYVGGSAYDTTGGLVQRMTVVKYDINGNQLWVAKDTTYSGSPYGMTVDGKGDVFMTGYSNGFTLVKFDSSGTFQWKDSLGTTTFLDYGTSVTSDANYVYATGGVGAPFWRDYRTVKLDISTGTVQNGWPQDYNGTGNYDDVPVSIAVDGSGNVFVTGYSYNGSGNKDYVTVGYDASGNTLTGWPQRFTGPADYVDDIPAQVLLSGNKVVVTGICNGSGPGYDTTGNICTIMYDYSGNIVSGWPQIYIGAGGWDGVGSSYGAGTYKPMAIDAAGNVYVGGWTRNDSGNYDMVTFKYNTAGVIQAGWPQFYNNGSNDDITRAIAVDASNDVCITGYTSPAGISNNGDYITIEYDPSGNMMMGWPVFYNGTANSDDQAQAIACVGENIYVTGYSTGAGTLQDYLTIQYSNSNLTVAVKDLSSDNNTVTVYPNPSSGKFTIHGAEPGSQLTITNVLGEVIYASKINSEEVQIDLSREARGIYFYKITSETSYISGGKLIID